ncbi:MAG: alpha/beta hydrolase [Planctomycetes bacterium]|nr:alpha/beta hydrolase [Planctomycetota bacterium]
MIFPLVVAGIATLVTLLLALSPALVWRGARTRAWLRRVLWLHAGLFLLHLFVTFPAALGWVGANLIRTRPQERTYAGPRLDAAGSVLVQSWKSLEAEANAGAPAASAEIVAAAAARARRIPSSDGVVLRAFRLEAKQEPPVATVVLVHGLFRSAMELEPIAALFRDQGCECWLVELRNFGGSTKTTFTAGATECDDVVAAVRFVRAQPGRAGTPMVLFGVSLGTVAVSLALPRIDGLAGVVLDAPIDDMQAAAVRMLGFDRAGDPRRWFQTWEPWTSLVLTAYEAWAGIDLASLRPVDVLATLPVDLPMLVVGAGIDERAPPATVEALFDRMPMHAHRRQLWMVPDSKHGHVFLDKPAEYAERLRWLLANLRR